jgi:hypothetical protein
MQNNSKQRLDLYLGSVEEHFRPSLMSPESLARIRKVARAFPAFAVDFFGFECRLGDENADTDCAMNLTPDGARMLAGRHPVAAPDELQGEAWDRLRGFYQEWGDTRRQEPYVDARATWLEFDTSAESPSPNLLFGYWPRDRRMQRPLTWLVDTVIPLLLGNSVSQGFRRKLIYCLESCPAETGDFQIGLMFSRNIQAARLCVFDLPAGGVLPYLDGIGWGGPKDELRDYLDAFRPHSDLIGLHLDIGEKVYPHIGVEPAFDAGCWARQPHIEPRWHGQFARLSEFGLITPAKKEALLSWIGHQRFSFEGQESVLLRGLSHVKITLRGGAPPLAKAYFGITQRALSTTA